MMRKRIDPFCWFPIDGQGDATLTDAEKYQAVVQWAIRARGIHPNAFDALTEWILEDSQWTEDRLAENEEILMRGVLARFREQNARLRTCLEGLEPGIVNAAVYPALDRFDEELSGHSADEQLQSAVSRMFADFSAMRERDVRKAIAGSVTGPFGTDTKEVTIYGYLNFLKDCDAAVQWALFMPDMVRRQQDGFKVETFEYRKLPAMRFVGREISDPAGADARDTFRTLDALDAYRSGFDYDMLFQHHYGRGVDVERWHGFWGRFMKADAPVPEGFCCFDFVPRRDFCDPVSGPPFLAQFAFATFSGNPEAIHQREGYDSDAMYDVTRNIMLGQGTLIPYPDKYWTAEVFLNGYDRGSSAYLFSAEL